MIIPLTLLFGAVGYLFYKSKDEVDLNKEGQFNIHGKQSEDDDLYKNLEDLFI